MSLADGDLKAIGNLIKVTISEDETLTRKSDIAHLPTKDEFYEETAEIRKDLEGINQELVILNHRSANHSDRIENVEKKLKIKPSFA